MLVDSSQLKLSRKLSNRIDNPKRCIIINIEVIKTPIDYLMNQRNYYNGKKTTLLKSINIRPLQTVLILNI